MGRHPHPFRIQNFLTKIIMISEKICVLAIFWYCNESRLFDKHFFITPSFDYVWEFYLLFDTKFFSFDKIRFFWEILATFFVKFCPF